MTGAAAGLLLGLQALAGGPAWSFAAPDVVGLAGGIALRMDALGAFFLVLIGMVAAPAALYGVGYSAGYDGPLLAPRPRGGAQPVPARH